MYRCFFINETPIRKSSSLQKLNVFTIYLTVHKTKRRQFVLHVIHTTIYGIMIGYNLYGMCYTQFMGIMIGDNFDDVPYLSCPHDNGHGR